MKKYLVLLLVLLCIPVSLFAEVNTYESKGLKDTLKMKGISADLSGYSESDDKMNIYLFWGNGCGHCSSYLNYVASSLVKDYGNKVNFISYEVWKSTANNELMQKVGEVLNLSNVGGVPLIVIGEKSFVGYSESRNEQITAAIDEALASEEKVDVIKKAISADYDPVNSDEQDNKDDGENKEESGNSNLSKKETSKKDSDLVIKIILIVVGVCLGVIFIVFLSKPKKDSNKDKISKKKK